jgi:ABC-type sugar transport system ATPase subunit
VDLSIGDGEFVGVVGPSGSGKSTLLRAIAGLDRPTEGTIWIGGVDVTQRPPSDRDVTMMFQHPRMLPNRTVRRNVAFPLELRGVDAEQIDQRVAAEMNAQQIAHLAARRADELSVGEQQVVQIARVLVRSPRVLLLDEPMSALDEPRRAVMRSELVALQAGYAVTTLMSTNDPLDSVTMPGRLVVVEAGRIVQDATPTEVRSAPVSLGAALATGPMAALHGVVRAHGSTITIEHTPDEGDARPGRMTVAVRADALVDRIGDDVWLGIRPDDVVLADPSSASIVAEVDRVIPGSVRDVRCRLGGQWFSAAVEASRVRRGESVGLGVVGGVVIDPTTERVICPVVPRRSFS